MIRALKVTMIIWGAIAILAGLQYIIIPEQAAQRAGFGQIADYVRWFNAFSGAIFISCGVWTGIIMYDRPARIAIVPQIIIVTFKAFIIAHLQH